MRAVESASRELVRRILIEQSRPPGSGETLRVGGVAKIGAALEVFLKAVAVALAAGEGVDLDAAAREVRGSSATLARLGAGECAMLIVRRLAGSSTRDRALRLIVDDLAQRRTSRIWPVIELRNGAAHAGRLDVGELRVLAEARKLLERQRELARWERVSVE